MLTVTQLNAMSVQDLIALNRMVVTVVKAKQKAENTVATFSFRVGDKVNYNGKFGPTTGTISEVKRTKVVVKTAMGNYLVPASMLRKGE